jgi:hypothetical protein
MTTFEEKVFQQTVDPAKQPELASELVQELTEPKAQPPPMLMAPPTNVVELLGGYLDVDRRLHIDAKIREITGRDEEAFAREMRNPRIPVARMVDLILRHTVTAVGTLESVTSEILGGLLVGDRSWLLLQVRILTFGSDWEVPDFPCRLCGQTFGVVLELDKDIPIKRMADPSQQEVNVLLRDGRTASVALMTGAVQLDMIGDGNRTAPEEQTIAIDRCIRRIDGQPGRPPLAQAMSMADRHKIITAMDDAQPGPQMEEVVVQCERCGQEAKYSLSLLDLFR